MHGLIFTELKAFVVSKAGGEGWNAIVKEAGLEGKLFLSTQTYADGELERLVEAGSKVTGIPVQDLERAFGVFIAPELLKLYQSQINPQWRTLDLVEKTESMVHRAVRLKVPGAQPPRLVVTRPAPDRLVLEYTSNRKMCAVAVGIIEGIAKKFGETVALEQTECMHRGDPRCLINVQRVA